MKVKKENNVDTYLEIACVHLMKQVKQPKVYEMIIDHQSTFMCPKCYKSDKMFKDIENGSIDDWFSVCRHCVSRHFKTVEIINK